MTAQTEQQLIERRQFFGIGAGAAVLASTGTALAQAGQPSPAPQAANPTNPGAANPGAADPGKVAIERRAGVVLLGIDRPNAQNRMSPEILIGLGKALHQFEHDDALRVAVVHGIGRDFCLGVDLPAFAAAQASGVLPPKDPDYINPLGLRPPYRSKPVVVAVHGGTKYAGHELFLAADIRIAANDTVFSQGEVGRGIFPGGGATIRFPREAGWGNAMRYMLTGEEWGPEEARRMGLVQEVTDPGKQLERAIAIAERISANAPLGVRATLASAHQAIANEDAAFAALQTEFPRILQSNDAKEFQKALREGRRPAFLGN
jgi:enoyl-CoA hydratase/carnithine racemase